ncbi:right-handed parallel beta-helix repeat-containing protein [Vibrio casei]|uniref:Exopolygalacturonate lyase n=1 Tax=Vibrio casei TaxID=673372 RepID=A0A368LI09_9VIBR|nr:exopolygalacturonate lyase [Vibrio casei]RCS70389.1 exopolygalacturonate lyase [Vibrio casei]SJN20502.1 Exopolygalacturonate lyase [Vibrio casei]
MKKTTLSVCLAILLSPAVLAANTIPNANNLTWHAITFGQSTDLNFGSTILPEKVGTNQVTVDGKKIDSGKLANKFTIESRGGKLANSHEGVTYYYTALPTDVNFTLTADIQLEQLGPETGATPNRQEGAGIMIRDVIGKPRMDPQPQGMEEFPAASNMVMNALRANKKAVNGLTNINGIYREGIYQPWGTGGNKMSRDEYLKGVPFGPKTHYKMSVTRTDSGFTVSYDDGKTQKTQPLDGAHANIVEMQDPKTQYVGFFASRNAKINVSDVKLTLSEAKTVDAPKYQAKLNELVFENASSPRTASDDYLVQARANYAGTFSLTQDGESVVKDQTVKAGELFSYEADINNASSDFEITFTASEGPNLEAQTHKVVVTKSNVADVNDIYVSPNGVATNDGSKANPMNLATAMELLAQGGTIYLEDGDYPAITIEATASGNKDNVKNLVAKGDNVRFVGEVIHKAHYWHYTGIEVSGAQFIVHGSHNTFEKMSTHDAPDTGFQITSPAEVGKALWASYNTVIDSESYNNMDKSRINADGFAAKMRVGEGNTFIRCISHHNADDGWDLFNKVEDGPNGAVTILDSISFMNGQNLGYPNQGGTIGNGFKLGGEGLPVPHVIKNSLAFANNMDGFTDNFNPGTLTVENNASIDNKRFNYLFRLSPYSDEIKQGTFTHNTSLRFYQKSQYDDSVNSEKSIDNAFYQDGKTQFSDNNTMDAKLLEKLKAAAKIDESQKIPGRAEALKLKDILFK